MEAKLEAKLRIRVRSLGGYAWKWVAPGVSGVPDRIVLMPQGKVYFVETKWGRNGLSPQQKLIHRILNQFGFKVFTIATEEQLNDFLSCINS